MVKLMLFRGYSSILTDLILRRELLLISSCPRNDFQILISSCFISSAVRATKRDILKWSKRILHPALTYSKLGVSPRFMYVTQEIGK